MHEISIYQTQLDIGEDQVAALWPLLSRDEQARANRFYFPRHKRRFVVARGTLRKILSEYLSIAPEKIQFEYLSHGKPQLAKQPKKPVYFNVAHSHEMALYAVADQPEIGVDIEFIHRDIVPEEIVDRYFSAQEIVEFFQYPPEKRREIFFHGWTRKEAFIKAIGEGLSFPLKDFDVSLREDAAALLTIYGDPELAKNWSMFTLFPASGYIAAVAVKTNPCEHRTLVRSEA